MLSSFFSFFLCVVFDAHVYVALTTSAMHQCAAIVIANKHFQKKESSFRLVFATRAVAFASFLL